MACPRSLVLFTLTLLSRGTPQPSHCLQWGDAQRAKASHFSSVSAAEPRQRRCGRPLTRHGMGLVRGGGAGPLRCAVPGQGQPL
jgi:hypothetical protein